LISCADFMAEIGNYLEGDVAEEVRRRLEDHLSHCRTCHLIVDTTRQTLTIVTDSGSFDLPEEASSTIARGVMARIRGMSQ
jgi:Putative zinc-finger